MKKKLLGGLLVVAIAAVAAFNVNMNTQVSELSLLALANVEALAQSEGTAVNTCYTSSMNGSFEHYLQCNSSTTENMIYSCPSSNSYAHKGISSKCTK